MERTRTESGCAAHPSRRRPSNIFCCAGTQGKEAPMPLRRAAELLPNDPEAQCNLEVLRALGFAGAVAVFPTSIERCRNTEAHSRRIFERQAGRRGRVPYHRPRCKARTRNCTIISAMRCSSSVSFEEAIPRYRSAPTMNPNVARYYSNLANALALGRLEQQLAAAVVRSSSIRKLAERTTGLVRLAAVGRVRGSRRAPTAAPVA